MPEDRRRRQLIHWVAACLALASAAAIFAALTLSGESESSSCESCVQTTILTNAETAITHNDGGDTIVRVGPSRTNTSSSATAPSPSPAPPSTAAPTSPSSALFDVLTRAFQDAGIVTGAQSSEADVGATTGTETAADDGGVSSMDGEQSTASTASTTTTADAGALASTEPPPKRFLTDPPTFAASAWTSNPNAGAGAFITAAPPWAASAWTSDPNAGAGRFGTETRQPPPNVVYYLPLPLLPPLFVVVSPPPNAVVPTQPQ